MKPEIYRVAERYGFKVYVVSNSYMNVPRVPGIELVVVADSFDAADDWIAERVSRGDIVVTADVPLASRCVKAGADAIAPNGRAFTEASVGMAPATRNLMQDLREAPSPAVRSRSRPATARPFFRPSTSPWCA